MLPVLEIAEQITAHLARANRLVLTAPTGSGKTTQVPQILHRSPTFRGGQIIVLQPRRLATRMVALRVAKELGCDIGGVVGYQTRHDSRMSRETKIRFMTEGLFLRLIHSEPKLPGVAAVVLDEFHERSLAADLSLGLVRRLQESGRDDLRLVVMSATLDAELVAGYLGCQALRAGGRLYPVDIKYMPKRSTLPPWELAAEAVASWVDSGERDGDALVFMPGMFEINRTISACQSAVRGADVEYFPLHGELSPKQQDAALAPLPGRRKVVVATNVAETSITIEGIRCVIDSGLARTNRYDPKRGINVLKVEPISRASADQRAGRAGRTAPGVCLRLWTSTDHAQRESHETPEVRRLELAEAVLQMKSMGINPAPGSFPWLEPPAPEVLQQADALLRTLGAIDERGTLTSTGQTMARFPAHPRLSRMMIQAAGRGCLRRATVWAALVAERDVFLKSDPAILRRYEQPDDVESDVSLRERALEAARTVNFEPRQCTELGVNGVACREIDRTSRLFEELSTRLGLPTAGANATSDVVKSLLVGFPDHLAMKLGKQRLDCAVSGRKKVTLDRSSIVKSEGLLIAMEMQKIGRGGDSQTVLSMASHVEAAWLEELYGGRIETRFETRWNDELKAVEEVEQRVFEGLVIEETARPCKDTSIAAELIVERIRSGELKLENWNEAVEQWIIRTRLAGAWFPEKGLIKYDEDDLRVILHEIVGSATRWGAVRDKPVMDAVRGALNWDEQQLVEKAAPGSVMLPSGYPMKIEYREGAAPKGNAKIQQLYGLEDTPRVGGGRQKVLLEILGPNYRPVQVTDDLKSFWANTYPELRKELKRRYPKHEWR
jgi:ATP-dependent helicase HrpB